MVVSLVTRSLLHPHPRAAWRAWQACEAGLCAASVAFTADHAGRKHAKKPADGPLLSWSKDEVPQHPLP